MKNRALQYKLLFGIFVALFLLFLCGDFGVPAISETAVITAVGVEKADDGGFDLTFVLAGTNENGERENRLVTTSAPTVAGGVEMLESGFGLTPKLSFTSLVILSKEIADGEIFDVISFFLNTNGVHDSAKLLVADGGVFEILEADIQSEKDKNGGLSKVLATAENTPFALPQINLKDFAESYFSFGIDPFLCGVSLEKIGEQTVFNLGEGYLFCGDKITSKINGDTILAFNILKGNGKEGSFTVEDVEMGDVTSNIRLSIADVSCKVEKTCRLGIPKVAVEVTLTCGLLDQSNSSKTLAQISGTGADKEAIATAVSAHLEKSISGLLQTSFATNSDFLGIGETLLLKRTKDFAPAPNYLQYAHAEINIQTKVLQNHRL